MAKSENWRTSIARKILNQGEEAEPAHSHLGVVEAEHRLGVVEVEHQRVVEVHIPIFQERS